jgi:hypothetical protein
MLRIGFLSVALLGLWLPGTTSRSADSAASMRRELRGMVGYTIVASVRLREVRDRPDGKYAVLDDGGVFKLNGPSAILPSSDVVVFAKRFSPELGGRSYDGYKLLINDEFLEASLQ